jgi:hypothetical protein
VIVWTLAVCGVLAALWVRPRGAAGARPAS